MTTKPDPLIGVIASKLEALGAALNVNPTTVGRAVLKYLSTSKVPLNVFLEALDQEPLQNTIKDLIAADRIEMTVDEDGELKYQAKNS